MNIICILLYNHNYTNGSLYQNWKYTNKHVIYINYVHYWIFVHACILIYKQFYLNLTLDSNDKENQPRSLINDRKYKKIHGWVLHQYRTCARNERLRHHTKNFHWINDTSLGRRKKGEFEHTSKLIEHKNEWDSL